MVMIFDVRVCSVITVYYWVIVGYDHIVLKNSRAGSLVFLLTVPRRFICCSYSLYVAGFIFVLLFVSHVSFWCLLEAMLCDCGLS